METQESVGKWVDETFPGTDPESPRKALRAFEEMVELCLAFGATVYEMIECISNTVPQRQLLGERCPKPHKIEEEAADVLIVLYAVAHMRGFDLHNSVDLKMWINRRREWRVKGDGTGYHVPKEVMSPDTPPPQPPPPPSPDPMPQPPPPPDPMPPPPDPQHPPDPPPPLSSDWSQIYTNVQVNKSYVVRTIRTAGARSLEAGLDIPTVPQAFARQTHLKYYVGAPENIFWTYAWNTGQGCYIHEQPRVALMEPSENNGHITEYWTILLDLVVSGQSLNWSPNSDVPTYDDAAGLFNPTDSDFRPLSSVVAIGAF